MKRDQLAHVIRAAQEVSGCNVFILIGSQAANVQIESRPEAMALSPELDMYPLDRPDLAELIDGNLGEGSAFHTTFGFYAQGVGPETAQLPLGWRTRAIERTLGDFGATVIAPELHDLCVSKAIAGRPKDRTYIASALSSNLVSMDTLL